MILDNKESNASWMRTVCNQFIDMVVQVIIEPDYSEDVLWTLHFLMELESEWTVVDIYNLIKNGIILFHDQQSNFHRYLIMIRNFALRPSLKIYSSSDQTCVSLRNILESCDINNWSR